MTATNETAVGKEGKREEGKKGSTYFYIPNFKDEDFLL